MNMLFFADVGSGFFLSEPWEGTPGWRVFVKDHGMDIVMLLVVLCIIGIVVWLFKDWWASLKNKGAKTCSFSAEENPEKALKEVRKQLERVRKDRDKAIADLEKKKETIQTLEDTLTRTKQDCDKDKKAALAAKDAEIAEKVSEIRNLNSQHATELDTLKETHAGEVSSLRAQIDSERTDHQDQLARKDRECNSRVTELKQNYDAEKQRLIQDRDDRLAAKDDEITDVKARSRAEIDRLEKACADMLSRFWPDASGGNAELAVYTQKWVSEMRDSENIPDSVMGMLSQLFCWKTAVSKGKLTAQYDSLAEFSRNFFEWCGAQGMSAEEARVLAVRFAEVFNTSVLTDALIPEDKRYNVFVPEIGAAYDAKRMVPSSAKGAKVGTSVQIETWGVITAGKKPEMKKRANVILK